MKIYTKEELKKEKVGTIIYIEFSSNLDRMKGEGLAKITKNNVSQKRSSGTIDPDCFCAKFLEHENKGIYNNKDITTSYSLMPGKMDFDKCGYILKIFKVEEDEIPRSI